MNLKVCTFFGRSIENGVVVNTISFLQKPCKYTVSKHLTFSLRMLSMCIRLETGLKKWFLRKKKKDRPVKICLQDKFHEMSYDEN